MRANIQGEPGLQAVCDAKRKGLWLTRSAGASPSPSGNLHLIGGSEAVSCRTRSMCNINWLMLSLHGSCIIYLIVHTGCESCRKFCQLSGIEMLTTHDAMHKSRKAWIEAAQVLPTSMAQCSSLGFVNPVTCSGPAFTTPEHEAGQNKVSWFALICSIGDELLSYRLHSARRYCKLVRCKTTWKSVKSHDSDRKRTLAKSYIYMSLSWHLDYSCEADWTS
jgi:hypothetical protein